MIVQTDKLGRIVLKKKLRDKYGKQFILIDKENEITLKPLHLDMSDLSKKIEKYSVSQLKELAEEEAIKEVGQKIDDLRRY
ncbi:MAG: hypothetical protein AABX48_02530 [Nanoarchaeota archaeon]